MIHTKYRVAGEVNKRYVRKYPGKDLYMWCETSLDNRYDLAQGTCEAEDLPADIIEKCELDGVRSCFYTCEWPLEKYNVFEQ